MAKKIFPGNYVNRPSSFQGQPIVCLPGRLYYHITGYALVSATGGTSFDVIIPSPDKRADDKPRASVTGLVVPSGANVYHLALRVPDMRKDRAIGTATSGLVGTATNRLKLASAVGTTAGGTIAAGALGTDSSAIVVAASTTVVPVANTESVITPVATSGALTLKVYVTATGGTTAGSTLTSTQAGGTPLICEVAYYLDDVCGDLDDTILPFITEAGTG